MKRMIEETAVQAPDLHGLSLRQDPDDVYGLQFTRHTRIFLFESTAAQLYIDFVPQQLVPGALYIIPPLHFHYLKEHGAGRFFCVDIDQQSLNAHHKQLLYAIKYNSQKSLLPLTASDDDCSYDALGLLAATLPGKQILFEKITRWIEQRLSIQEPGRFRTQSYTAIEIADHFLNLLAEKNLNTQTCKVAAVASELCHSERTLHRASISAFGLCIKDILNYHLIVKAIYMLAGQHRSISEIAHELNFSNVTAFGRYVKRGTGYTASGIRESLRAAGIEPMALQAC